MSSKYYRVHTDFETFSWLNLLKVGADRYAQHHSTEVLMLAWAVDDGPVQQWVPSEDGDTPPQEFLDLVADPYAIFFAWNKAFEWAIFKHVLGITIPHKRWRDPMVMAYSLSLPGSLEKAGKVLGIDEDKQKMADGKALIRVFCQRRKPTKNKPERRVLPHHEPEKWDRFKLYNRNDVEAERANYKKMLPYNMPKEEWELWLIDQEINSNGLPIDMEMVDNAVDIYLDTKAEYLGQMATITGLDNPNSPAQLLPWLQELGYPFDDLKKGHVRRALDRAKQELEEGLVNDIDSREMLIRVLDLRLEVSQTSSTKFMALQRAVDRKAGVLRNSLQFAGAGRTWRWAGRIFQAQNLPRPAKYLEDDMEEVRRYLRTLDAETLALLFSKPMEVLKSGIRPAAAAPEGYTFVVADLNAIENRVLGWMADCQKILDVFRKGQDPYIAFACDLFGGTYAENWHEYKVEKNGTKRTISKPGVLGCGYRLGAGERHIDHKTGEEEATGLLGYAWNMGIREFTEADAKLSVETFRREFNEVTEFWFEIERAAKKCVRTGRAVTCRMLEFDRKGPFLRMRLPSGRYLHYCRPRIMDWETPWGEMKPTLTYEGVVKNQWKRQATHGGKLTENADQAMSRDLLAHGMRRAYREGLDIRLHVHDELLALSEEAKAEAELKLLIECMQDQPRWAKGLPLGAAGFISPFFTKD